MKDLYALCFDEPGEELSGLGAAKPSVKAQLFEVQGDIQVAAQEEALAEQARRKRMSLAIGSVGVALVTVGVIGYLLTRKK
jgi:hypothetical protein